MSTIRVFPTSIALESISKTLVGIEDSAFSLPVQDNQGNKRSVSNKVLDSTGFEEVKQKLEGLLNKHFKNTINPYNSEITVYITQSWINYSTPGEYHHQHRHSNSVLSGCLWIHVDETCDNITFFKPNNRECNNFIIPFKHPNEFNTNSWELNNIKRGDVAIWDSSILHCVNPVPFSKYRGTRVSIAFNTFIKGEIGSEDSLNNVTL
jgi:uncharacterized protein (TIGR02466 family)